MKNLMRLILKHKFALIFSVLCAVAGTLATLYIPILLSHTIDGIERADFSSLGQIALQITLFAAAASGLNWLLLSIVRNFSAKITRNLRANISHAISKAPLSTFDSLSPGDAAVRLGADAENAGEAVNRLVSQLLPATVTIGATMLFLLRLHVPLALLVIFATPITALVAWSIGKKTMGHFRRAATFQGQMSAFAEEYIPKRDTISALGAAGTTCEKFSTLSEEYRTAHQRATTLSSIAKPGSRLVGALVYLTLALFGAFAVMAEQLTVGELVALLTLSAQFARPFGDISAQLAQITQGLAATERVFVLLDLENSSSSVGEHCSPLQKTISIGDCPLVFQHVSFAYEETSPILENLSFTLPPGKTLAITGKTGAGKTTILSLIMQFYQPQKGQILLGDTPIHQIDPQALHGKIGMILQHPWIKRGTIRENIALPCPDATMAQIEDAAKKAKADRFIRDLPHGYDTVLDGTIALSQGQRQLLAAARAFLQKPDILLLDEATSALDTHTETLVTAAFADLMQDKTTIIVAHRKKTIEGADLRIEL